MAPTAGGIDAGAGRNTREHSKVATPVVRELFRYPDPVNENAARLIAAGVVALVALYIGTGSGVVLVILAYGFVARVLTGPTLSPWAQVVSRVLVPWLSIPTRPVPGLPKRFAQGIGAVLSFGAVVAHTTGFGSLTTGLVALIGIAATLESVFGFCVGCWIFARLMDAGLVPASVCEACNDLSLDSPRGHATSRTKGS